MFHKTDNITCIYLLFFLNSEDFFLSLLKVYFLCSWDPWSPLFALLLCSTYAAFQAPLTRAKASVSCSSTSMTDSGSLALAMPVCGTTACHWHELLFHCSRVYSGAIITITTAYARFQKNRTFSILLQTFIHCTCA